MEHAPRDEKTSASTAHHGAGDAAGSLQAASALHPTEARDRDLFDRAPVMYVTTRNEAGVPVIDDCNALFLSTLGYDRDQVVGRSLGEFYAEPSREALLGSGNAAALAGTLPPTERQLLTRDGRHVDVLAIMQVGLGDHQPRGTHLSFVDITARKEAEAALRERVEQAQELLELALDCVIATDSAGHVVLFNAAAERTFGRQRSRVIGKPLAELIIPPEVREESMAGCDPSLDHGLGLPLGKRIETTAVRADGSRFPIELSLSVVAGADGPMFVGYLRDISERVAIETALRSSEARFRALVQQSYDVITVVGRDGQRRYLSPSIERVLGYAAEDLVDSSVLGLVHPDDAPAFNAAFASLLAGARQTPALELRFRHRDGSWRDFETVGANLLDEPGVNGIVFNSREITGRKAAEAALRTSEQQFRTVFDHAPIGLATVAPDGQFTRVNRSLYELLGYTEADLLSKRFQEITHPDDLQEDLKLAGRLFAGKIDAYQIETRYLRKDGHPIWIELTASIVPENGHPAYAVTQVQDVTGRRNLDLERATMLASERAYTRELRDLSTMRADFSTMVAHELRSPVAALRMMISTIETGALTPEVAAETMIAVHGQIDQLDRLANDVAATAAAERDNFSVQLHPVPLSVLISGAASFARGALGERPFTLGPTPDVPVWCDPERISQVLQNLLDNVAKHTPPDAPVALRTKLRDGRVHITVSDGGPGISPADLPIVFEKFGRGRDAADRQIPGLGLGLYLSHQIAQAHGTELTISSSSEGGSVFNFDLRVAR